MRSAYDVIIKPVISEQSMDQAQEKSTHSKLQQTLTRHRLN